MTSPRGNKQTNKNIWSPEVLFVYHMAEIDTDNRIDIPDQTFM